MDSELPLGAEVVLVGGGHAHALLLKRWGMNPVPGVRLTVVNPAPSAPYTGMLPGYIAGHYGRDDLEIDLVRLARFAGARLVLGIVHQIDRAAKTIHIEGRPPLPYDIASIDIGISSNMPEIKGFSDHGVAAKPLGPYALRWLDFLAAPGPVGVIGGGVAGVELALAMAHRLVREGHRPEITVVEAATALTGLSEIAAGKLRQALQAAGIKLIENAEVAEVTPDGILLRGGAHVPSAFTVGAAGARPFEWLKDTGLTLQDGYISVGPDLRSLNDPSIYAAGDCAHLSHAPRPKAGVFAVRAAPVLTHNIRADLTGQQRRSLQPQARYLKLISLGRKAALADRGVVAPSGNWVWAWKDWIDQRFMKSLSALEPMAPTPAPKGAALVALGEADDLPLCGGCGAKVASGTLDTVLAKQGQTARSDVVLASGDDAAILRLGTAEQVISTDHLRSFWPDPYLSAKIALCHALGDVWAMGAEPQAILAQITLPRLSAKLQDAWLTDIMAGASDVADVAGAAIVGGHTSVGAELTLGFTVTGILRGDAKAQSRAKPGDALILTRPIGNGVILAGEMRLLARGTEVVTALKRMATPSQDAAMALCRANAITDVTGFGLAGHLDRMMRASGVGAEIRLEDVPLTVGALRLARNGVQSSLYAANRAALPGLASETGPRADLLFDPQTAGGYLASVPGSIADEVLEELKVHAPDARIIGRVTATAGLRLV